MTPLRWARVIQLQMELFFYPLCFLGWNLTRGILHPCILRPIYMRFLYRGRWKTKPSFGRIGVFTAFSVALVRSLPPFRKGHFLCSAQISGGLFFSHGSTRQGTWRRSSAVAGYTWAASTELFDPRGCAGWKCCQRFCFCGAGFNCLDVPGS